MMKTIRIMLLALSTWLVWLLVSQYLLCARFDFQEPVPFEGAKIYNPYESIDSDSWLKCNFHAHARAWNGLTNGHGTASDIHDAYKNLGYQVHCVSNYHYIDTTYASNDHYIPAYEHGYNVRKTHQLVLGSYHVQWLDYLFPQTLHNKQHVLQQLIDTTSLIILNHPGLRNGYEAEDFASLSGYQCMEVLNPSIISTKEWDNALSSGKRVFIVGNDDIHNVLTKERLGRMCTFVNVQNKGTRHVLDALRTGRSYGVAVDEKHTADVIPSLSNLKVRNDTITLKMSDKANEITVTGQDGKLVESFRNTDFIQYRIRKEYHYARITCRYRNGTTIYLNPVFFVPDSGYTEAATYEDIKETTFFRTMGIMILFLWALIIWRTLPVNPGGHPYRGRLSTR